MTDSILLIQNTLPISSEIMGDAGSLIIEQKATSFDKFLFGLFIGLTSTFIYYIVSMIFRPRLRISKHISREKDDTYRIKIINKTFSNIEKLEMELFLMKQEIADKNGNKNFQLIKLNLQTPEYTFIHGLLKRIKELNDNCVQLLIKENLEKVWSNSNDVLVFNITCHHSLSGNRKIKRVHYHHPESTIIPGEFKTGNTMRIE